jgi:site-specific DNA-methyltransferase (adenine-specific)
MVKFIVGRCENVMPTMEAESTDLVVTSPPYNRGVVYRTYVDRVEMDKYLKWTVLWCEQVKRLLTSKGSFFLNLAGSPSDPWLPYEVITRLGDMFVLQNTFHWIKAISFKDESRGHFKPINSKRFVNNCHEFVFHLTKTGEAELDRKAIGVPYEDKSNVRRWGHTDGNDSRCRGNNWFIPYQTIQNRNKQRPHPATFPVELVEFCIKLTHPRRMLDPFVGLGTSAVAAVKCGVPEFDGIDIDKHYIDEAKRRISQLAIANGRVEVIEQEMERSREG